MRALALAAVLLVGLSALLIFIGIRSASSSSSGNETRSEPASYPPATAKFDGRTAEEWGQIAKDRDWFRAEQGFEALNRLGSQAVPYHLAALEAQANGGDLTALASGLGWLHADLIHPTDTQRLRPFLDERYSSTDDWQGGGVRMGALATIRRAGSKARPLSPTVRALCSNPKLKKVAEETLAAIAR
jgi:hypothetical protein